MLSRNLRRAVGVGLKAVYNTTETYASDAGIHTFSGVDIGAAEAGRLVVVVATCMNTTTSTDMQINSVTIGGVAATVHANLPLTTANGCAIMICSRQMDAGATADIIVDPSATAQSWAISTYSLTGLSSYTEQDSNTDGGDSGVLVQVFLEDVVTGSLIIQGVVTAEDQTITNDSDGGFSSITTDYANVLSTDGHTHRSGVSISSTTFSNYSILSGNELAAVMVSWR